MILGKKSRAYVASLEARLANTCSTRKETDDEYYKLLEDFNRMVEMNIELNEKLAVQEYYIDLEFCSVLLGITYKELAAVLGVSTNTLLHYRKDPTKFTKKKYNEFILKLKKYANRRRKQSETVLKG